MSQEQNQEWTDWEWNDNHECYVRSREDFNGTVHWDYRAGESTQAASRPRTVPNSNGLIQQMSALAVQQTPYSTNPAYVTESSQRSRGFQVPSGERPFGGSGPQPNSNQQFSYPVTEQSDMISAPRSSSRVNSSSFVYGSSTRSEEVSTSSYPGNYQAYPSSMMTSGSTPAEGEETSPRSYSNTASGYSPTRLSPSLQSSYPPTSQITDRPSGSYEHSRFDDGDYGSDDDTNKTTEKHRNRYTSDESETSDHNNEQDQNKKKKKKKRPRSRDPKPAPRPFNCSQGTGCFEPRGHNPRPPPVFGQSVSSSGKSSKTSRSEGSKRKEQSKGSSGSKGGRTRRGDNNAVNDSEDSETENGIDERELAKAMAIWNKEYTTWKDVTCSCGHGYYTIGGEWVSGEDVRNRKAPPKPAEPQFTAWNFERGIICPELNLVN